MILVLLVKKKRNVQNMQKIFSCKETVVNAFPRITFLMVNIIMKKQTPLKIVTKNVKNVTRLEMKQIIIVIVAKKDIF